MTENDKHTLLAAWLEDSLTQAQRKAFEQLCTEDADFALRVEMAGRCFSATESFTAPAPPAWNKSATFTDNASPRWYQWQGLPVASMAMSVLALVMVITGFRVEVSDSRLSLGFSERLDAQEVAALVEDRVDAYKQANQAVFRDYADALASQQRQSSAELTEYLLASSRKERREDFAELVKFINQQRSDDQQFYARQLHNLQQDVSALEKHQSMNPLISGGDPLADE
ncbi:hypothetical protein [Alteromonas halophila]|uniref:Uncharacterized protein n=1 Tax=Alteromonas halophila TaxID=516698 RepID=A0A918JHS1_9ALTE|nr:hypothetical protein [Alteromonas halophila]GGW81321.1 hypothetical protein GCM10007391_13120 [Alteromonas halophila]